MAWWYRALGTLRTRILAFWRPGKPKTDFDQVQIEEFSKTHFWLCQELRVSVCLSVRLSGTKFSKALNLHLSLIALSQVSLRSLCAFFDRQTEPRILRLVYLRLIFCQILIRTVGWMKTMVKINLPLPEKQQCSQLLQNFVLRFGRVKMYIFFSEKRSKL